jgi:hypothetical protein
VWLCIRGWSLIIWIAVSYKYPLIYLKVRHFPAGPHLLPPLFLGATVEGFTSNGLVLYAAFLGVLPPPPEGFSFKSTWEGLAARDPHRVEQEGWWDGEGVDEVHLQGRRWAGIPKNKNNAKRGMPYMGSMYDSEPTFNSYGESRRKVIQCIVLKAVRILQVCAHRVLSHLHSEHMQTRLGRACITSRLHSLLLGQTLSRFFEGSAK